MAETEDGTNTPLKRVTIRDVARHAGVSVPAVSKVLRGAYGVSPAMRARVQESISTLEYRPNASARGMRGKTFTIGVLIPDIANPFSALLVDSIIGVIKTAGYELLVGPGGGSVESQANTVDALRDRQMDGLILVSPLGTEDYLSSVGLTIPTVVVGRHGPAKHYDTIAGDDIVGARLVVEHLVGLGHESIAFIAHTEEPDSDPRLPQNVRLEGYRLAMEAAGLGEHVDVIFTMWSQAGGHAAAKELLKRESLPTALFGGSDVSALGALSEFWMAGIDIPAQISVSGYDNTEASAFAPVSLTSVDQGGEHMGAKAALMLLERMGGRREAQHIVTEPALVARRTTAAPR